MVLKQIYLSDHTVSLIDNFKCPLLNISYCPSTEETVSAAKNLVSIIY